MQKQFEDVFYINLDVRLRAKKLDLNLHNIKVIYLQGVV